MFKAGFEELGMAVVYQAAEDYFKLLKKKEKAMAEIANADEPMKCQTNRLDRINKSIDRLMKDLRGAWCNELSNGLAELLANELENNPEAVAERIRRNNEEARRQEDETSIDYADLLMEQCEQM
jgi:hypothetical protein